MFSMPRRRMEKLHCGILSVVGMVLTFATDSAMSIEIRLGFMGPYNDIPGVLSTSSDCPACGAAFAAAVHWLNTENPQWLDNNTVSAKMFDSSGADSGSKFTALQNAVTLLGGNDTCTINSFNDSEALIQDDTPFAVVADLYSSTLLVTALTGQLYEVPMVGYGATSDALSDKENFPYFSRVVPPDRYQAPGIANVVVQFGWDHVGVLHTDEAYGNNFADRFTVACHDRNVTVVNRQGFGTPIVPAILHQRLTVLRDSKVRVILLAAPSSVDLALIVDIAAMLGMTADGYVWLGTDGISRSVSVNTDLSQKLQGALMIQPSTYPSSKMGSELNRSLYKDQSTWKAAAQGFDPSWVPPTLQAPIDPWTYYVWDATMLVARAAVSISPNVSCLYDGICMQQAIRNEKIVNGATGFVELNKTTGDRSGSYEILNIRKDGSLHRIGLLVEDNYTQLNQTIHWSDGSMDDDVPSDGIDGVEESAAEDIGNAAALGISVGLGIPFILVLIYFALWRRNKIHEQERAKNELNTVKRTLAFAKNMNKHTMRMTSQTMYEVKFAYADLLCNAATPQVSAATGPRPRLGNLSEEDASELPLTAGQLIHVEQKDNLLWFGVVVQGDDQSENEVVSGWFQRNHVVKATSDTFDRLSTSHRSLLQRYFSELDDAMKPVKQLLERHNAIGDVEKDILTSALWDALKYGEVCIAKDLVIAGANVSERHPITHHLPHATVLRYPEPPEELLLIMFRKCCQIDFQIGGLLRDSFTLESVKSVFVELAKENWTDVEEDGATVLHRVVHACYAGAISPHQATAIAKQVIEVDPELVNSKDYYGHTAGDIAVLCNDDELERLLTLVVFGRYQVISAELHRSPTAIVMEARDLSQMNQIAAQVSAVQKIKSGTDGRNSLSHMQHLNLSSSEMRVNRATIGLPRQQGNQLGRSMCLKIMKDASSWKRELESRSVIGSNSSNAIPVYSAATLTSSGYLESDSIDVFTYRMRDDENDTARCLMTQYPHALFLPLADRNLHEIITNERLASESIDVIRGFAAKIGQCIQSLHSVGVVHGDIKPRNIVRTLPDHSFALLDFDMSFSLANRDDHLTDGLALADKLLATSAYVAPELLRESQSGAGIANPSELFGPQVDIWSWGVTVFEMITGTSLLRHSYDRATGESIDRLLNWDGLRKSDEDQLKLLHGDNLPVSLFDFFQWVLDPDPSARPKSMSECLKHAFFDTRRGKLREHFVLSQIRTSLPQDRHDYREYPPVLISYCSADSGFAMRLALSLAPLVDGLRYDPVESESSTSLYPSDRFAGIEAAIIVSSPAYKASSAAQREVKALESTGKMVIYTEYNQKIMSAPQSPRWSATNISAVLANEVPIDFTEIGLFDIKFEQELLVRLKKECAPHDFASDVHGLNDAFEVDTSDLRLPTELPRAFVDIGDVLGDGEFGLVNMGWVHPLDGDRIPVAVKRLKGNPDVSDASRGAFLKEAAINSQFTHPNVIALVGVVTVGEPNVIVLEFCENGAMSSLLSKHELSGFRLLSFCDQIASGMQYLASKQFVHRDLAARNCLINAKYVVKVADFGMTKALYDSTYYAQKTVGTKLPLRWLAPELFDTPKFTQASDIWAYGVTVVEIFTRGSVPYGAWSNDMVIERVKSGYRIPRPPLCPRELYEDIVAVCFAENPADRPTFAEIANLQICKRYQSCQEMRKYEYVDFAPIMLPKRHRSSGYTGAYEPLTTECPQSPRYQPIQEEGADIAPVQVEECSPVSPSGSSSFYGIDSFRPNKDVDAEFSSNTRGSTMYSPVSGQYGKLSTTALGDEHDMYIPLKSTSGGVVNKPVLYSPMESGTTATVRESDVLLGNLYSPLEVGSNEPASVQDAVYSPLDTSETHQPLTNSSSNYAAMPQGDTQFEFPSLPSVYASSTVYAPLDDNHESTEILRDTIYEEVPLPSMYGGLTRYSSRTTDLNYRGGAGGSSMNRFVQSIPAGERVIPFLQPEDSTSMGDTGGSQSSMV